TGPQIASGESLLQSTRTHRGFVAANLYRRTGGTTPHASTCRAEIEPNTQEDLTLVWTAEKIAGLGVDQVKDLRGNAAKRGAQGIVDLCDAELVRRRARRRTKRSNSSKQIHNVKPSTVFISYARLKKESLGIKTGRSGREPGWSIKITPNVRR